MANYRKLSRLIVDVVLEAQTFGGYESGLKRRQIQALLLARGVVLPKYALSKKLWDMRLVKYRHINYKKTGGVNIRADDGNTLFVLVNDDMRIRYGNGKIYDGGTAKAFWYVDQQTPPLIEGVNFNLRLHYDDDRRYWAFKHNMILAGFNRYSLKVATYKKKTKYGVYDKRMRRCVVWSNTQEEAEKLLTMYQGNKKLGF